MDLDQETQTCIFGLHHFHQRRGSFDSIDLVDGKIIFAGVKIDLAGGRIDFAGEKKLFCRWA